MISAVLHRPERGDAPFVVIESWPLDSDISRSELSEAAAVAARRDLPGFFSAYLVDETALLASTAQFARTSRTRRAARRELQRRNISHD